MRRTSEKAEQHSLIRNERLCLVSKPHHQHQNASSRGSKRRWVSLLTPGPSPRVHAAGIPTFSWQATGTCPGEGPLPPYRGQE